MSDDYKIEWERQYQSHGKLMRGLVLAFLFPFALVNLLLEAARWYWDRYADYE